MPAAGSFAHMGRNTCALMEDLHGAGRDAYIHLGSQIAIGDGVVMTADIDMIIDANPCDLLFGVDIRLNRQRSERVARDSGQWKGKRFIRGGRAELRQALYMPALVAMRFNADLKAVYDRLTEAGQPAKVAIVAVMRKLLILANALLKKGVVWAPKLN
jgi:hypothetical protein